MSGEWIEAADLETVRSQGRLLARVDGRRIALFATPDGIVACNNRCPHEGYPLSEGDLDAGCILTCNWHNWKFDLRSGENLYGGDRLRVYPTEIRDGRIWIDVTEAPPDERRHEALSALREAFRDNAYARMARELARLERLDVDPLATVSTVVGWVHDRFEFGWTHAFAGTADWLSLRDEMESEEDRLGCLLEGVGHMADDALREARYPFADGVAAYDEDAFVAAIEDEEETTAIAVARGALLGGSGFATLEGGLTRAALAHYADFGHALIYVTKARRLCDRLEATAASGLLLSLVRMLSFCSREDLVPEFRGYAQALARWGSGGDTVPAAGDWAGLGIAKALERTAAASRADPLALYWAMLGANALNLLRFDVAHQDRPHLPISANVGWLDFTHGITFASAVREQCTRFPALWPQGLLQMACFLGRNARYTDPAVTLADWRVEDPEAYLTAALHGALDHGHGEYIVSVHVLKTTLAMREEVRAGAPAEVAEALAGALNRFLNSPLRRKLVRRTAHQAVAFAGRE